MMLHSSISYSNIQDLITMFQFCEVFSKFDWKAAFKQIPLHPLSILLFKFVFLSFRIIFSTITFWLSQAPKLFSTFPKSVSCYLIYQLLNFFQLTSYPQSTFFQNFPMIFICPDSWLHNAGPALCNFALTLVFNPIYLFSKRWTYWFDGLGFGWRHFWSDN